MQVEGGLVFTKRTNRGFEMDLLFVEGNVELVLEFIGNHAGGDGTEEVALLISPAFEGDLDADKLLSLIRVWMQ